MNVSEHRTRSFIIRIWIESRDREVDPVVWRGVVELVQPYRPNDVGEANPGLPQHQAFDSLEGLIGFLIQHFIQMGIPPERLIRSS